MLVRFKKYAIKLFQCSSIVFDLHNKEPCDRLPAYKWWRNSGLTTSCTVERSFSMLSKLWAKDRHFSPSNVCKYLALQWTLVYRGGYVPKITRDKWNPRSSQLYFLLLFYNAILYCKMKQKIKPLFRSKMCLRNRNINVFLQIIIIV